MSMTRGAGDGEVAPWVLTALVAAGQAIAVALIIAIGSHDGGRHDVGAYVFAAGFGALLLLRSRLPVAVLITAVLLVFAYYAAGYPPIGMALPLVGAFYSAAERGRAAVAPVVGAVLLAVSLYFRITDGESSAVLAYDLITNVALIGCAIALALAVRSTRALRNQQRRVVALERHHQQERAARHLEAERLRIARDVHDSIGHALSLVSVQARVAQQSLGTDDAAVARALDNVVDATRSSLADLRRTLAILQSDREDAGRALLTLTGIERTAQAARDAGLDVTVSIDVNEAAIPAPTASTAFRIVQESVTNVLRHANANQATITVRSSKDELRVRVADDGHGARTEPGLRSTRGDGGRGIDGMRERAALLGGTLTAGSTPTGFTVEAVLPIGGAR
ncbi:sensor histidine kinase [Micromonospora sp. NPDC023814]|uniref:sensor histidine kinase n=1 Tax=Micromonospora sp. NPDC023814 TaxID=3154596 RepID=UPI00340C9A4E